MLTRFFLKRSNLIFLSTVVFMLFFLHGCGGGGGYNTDEGALLVGTWHLSEVNGEDASYLNYQLTISETMYTFKYPNCTEEGIYSINNNMLTVTTTSFNGTNCNEYEEVGVPDTKQYYVTSSQLTIIDDDNDETLVFKKQTSGDINNNSGLKKYTVDLIFDLDFYSINSFFNGHAIYIWKDYLDVPYTFQCNAEDTRVDVIFPNSIPSYIKVEYISENSFKFTFVKTQQQYDAYDYGVEPHTYCSVNGSFSWGSFFPISWDQDPIYKERIGAIVRSNY